MSADIARHIGLEVHAWVPILCPVMPDNAQDDHARPSVLTPPCWPLTHSILRASVYPHILATGGLHDPRVGYWEPAKLVARLREASLPAPASKSAAGDQPGLAQRLLLLKTDMGAGHFSVTGRFERLKEVGQPYPKL